MKTIPYGHQSINSDDIEAVIRVLKSDFITQGPMIPKFEAAVAKYCRVQYGVAVNSATSALHIACQALDLGKGDFLWTSPNTFVASANCALYCGAKVDFVDIDKNSYNMSLEALESKLKISNKNKTLPKIVIPVHFAGQSCEMARIAELGHEYGFHIIEDASHAIGGEYLNNKIGSCKYSDMAVFSFHPVKIITTGEGGMILTKQKNLYEKLKLLRSHGITRNKAQMTNPVDDPWFYQQIDLGYNYRMTDIQAALGLSQLKRVDDFVFRRQEIAKRYNKAFEKAPVTLPWQHPETYSAWHLFVVRLQSSRISKNKRQVFDAMRQNGIGLNVHYIPVHTQPYFNHLGFTTGSFPEAEKYYDEALSLPIFPDLSETEQDRVINTLINSIA